MTIINSVHFYTLFQTVIKNLGLHYVLSSCSAVNLLG